MTRRVLAECVGFVLLGVGLSIILYAVDYALALR